MGLIFDDYQPYSPASAYGVASDTALGIGGSTAATSPIGDNEVNPLFQYTPPIQPMQFDKYGRAGITQEQAKYAHNQALTALGLGLMQGGMEGTWKGIGQGITAGIAGYSQANEASLDKASNANIQAEEVKQKEQIFNTDLEQKKLTLEAAKRDYNEQQSEKKHREQKWNDEIGPVYENSIKEFSKTKVDGETETDKALRDQKVATAKAQLDQLKTIFTDGGDIRQAKSLTDSLDEMFPEAEAKFKDSIENKMVNNRMLHEDQRYSLAQKLWGTNFTRDNNGEYHRMTPDESRIEQARLDLLRSQAQKNYKYSPRSVSRLTPNEISMGVEARDATQARVSNDIEPHISSMQNWVMSIPDEFKGQPIVYDNFRNAIQGGMSNKQAILDAYAQLNPGSVGKSIKHRLGPNAQPLREWTDDSLRVAMTWAREHGAGLINDPKITASLKSGRSYATHYGVIGKDGRLIGDVNDPDFVNNIVQNEVTRRTTASALDIQTRIKVRDAIQSKINSLPASIQSDPDKLMNALTSGTPVSVQGVSPEAINRELEFILAKISAGSQEE